MNEKLIKEARNKFGLLFKELRKEKGLSQSQVADFCGVTFQTINKVEQGKYPYSIDLFFKLSVILDFSINLESKRTNNINRFLFQESKIKNIFTLTDTVNKIVCSFEYKKYNETQKFTFLNENEFSAIKLATIMREFSDFLIENHNDII